MKERKHTKPGVAAAQTLADLDPESIRGKGGRGAGGHDAGEAEEDRDPHFDLGIWPVVLLGSSWSLGGFENEKVLLSKLGFQKRSFLVGNVWCTLFTLFVKSRERLYIQYTLLS